MLVICASIYYVVPKIYGTEIYSVKLANAHFWLALVGQLLFSITMWITGIRQGWMWKATDEAGKLRYTFMDGVIGNYPYWHARTLAGIIFTAGMLCFVWNVLKTIQKGKALEAERSAQPTPTTAAA